MKCHKKGSIDYDYDKYGRKIRKYIVTGLQKVHGKHFPVWEQVLDFKPEREITKD